jgi:hypothetical protein
MCERVLDVDVANLSLFIPVIIPTQVEYSISTCWLSISGISIHCPFSNCNNQSLLVAIC